MNFVDLLFPKQCLSCNSWGQYICQSCSENIPTIRFQRCIICQKASLHGFTHPKCTNRHKPDRLICIYDYRNPFVTKIINTAKLGLVSELFVELTLAAITSIKASGLLSKMALCPIPLTKSKKRFRGFNQSLIIAKVFSKNFDLPIDAFLMKSKSTKQQKLLNKGQRQVNLLNSFSILNKESLPKYVLLIDDITTSGATFLEATKTLKLAGVQTVWCLALAQD